VLINESGTDGNLPANHFAGTFEAFTESVAHGAESRGLMYNKWVRFSLFSMRC